MIMGESAENYLETILMLSQKKGSVRSVDIATAKNVYLRHETITKWLIKIGVSADQAAIDACRIEHVISHESFECLKRFTEQV